jgi:hypothetical protein
LIPSATPTTRTATPYRNSDEVRFIEYILALYLSNVLWRHPLVGTPCFPLWSLRVFTLPFCGLERFEAYPICSIFEGLYVFWCPRGLRGESTAEEAVRKPI